MTSEIKLSVPFLDASEWFQPGHEVHGSTHEELSQQVEEALASLSTTVRVTTDKGLERLVCTVPKAVVGYVTPRYIPTQPLTLHYAVISETHIA